MQDNCTGLYAGLHRIICRITQDYMQDYTGLYAGLHRIICRITQHEYLIVGPQYYTLPLMLHFLTLNFLNFPTSADSLTIMIKIVPYITKTMQVRVSQKLQTR